MVRSSRATSLLRHSQATSPDTARSALPRHKCCSGLRAATTSSFTALPGSSTVEPGVTPAQSMTLSWATFTEAADQAGVSRRYGGIHFKADDLVGRQTGRLVADVVWNKAMSYINGTSQ